MHWTIVFIDESGFYLVNGRIRTYSPKGARPVLKVFQSRDHLSVLCALTDQGKIYTRTHDKSLTSQEVVLFLRHLLRYLVGPVLVIWDRGGIHRGDVEAFLATRAGRRIQVERLPAYAPELNPCEWVWEHLKDTELRGVCCLNIRQLKWRLHQAIMRLRTKPHLLLAFFAGAGLPLDS